MHRFGAMRAEQLMCRDIKVCRATDHLSDAARTLWDCDLGFLPVVDETGKLVGTLTDRDICMAAYTQGQAISAIPVSTAMARRAHACRNSDPLQVALQLMQQHQLRRIPVVDGEWRVVGVLAIADLVDEATREGGAPRGVSTETVVRTLAAVTRPRQPGERPRTAGGNGRRRDLSAGTGEWGLAPASSGSPVRLAEDGRKLGYRA